MFYFLFTIVLGQVLVHHWFLHNFFNTHPIMNYFGCNSIFFIKSIPRDTYRFCTKPWSITALFWSSRRAFRTKQGKFTTIDNETQHRFLHNLFNTHPILIFCCNRIFFLQSIHSDTCRFCMNPWSVTIVFLSSIGSSRTFVDYQHNTVPIMKRSVPSFNQKISAAAIYIYPQDEYSSETVDLDEIGGVE